MNKQIFTNSRFIMVLLVALCIAPSISCETEEQNDSTTELEGRWITNEDGLPLTYSFNGSKVNLCLSITYPKTNSPIYEFEFVFDYTNGEKVSTPPDAKKINITTQQEFVTIYDQDLIDKYNRLKTYGYTDWAVGAKKDVTGRESSPGSEDAMIPGEAIYDIYSIQGNKLYFGETDSLHDGSSDEKRPIKLSTSYLTKI